MTTPIQWRAPFDVNVNAAVIGTQTGVRIEALANGGFVIVWREAADGAVAPAPGSDLVAMMFDATGEVVRQPFQLNTARSLNDEDSFDIAATHDGFVITYVDSDLALPDMRTVITERFDLNGALVVDSEQVIADASSGTNRLRSPEIAAKLDADDDDIFVAYADRVPNRFDERVYARVIDETGTLSAPFFSGSGLSPFEVLKSSCWIRLCSATAIS